MVAFVLKFIDKAASEKPFLEETLVSFGHGKDYE
jgi:hypothetical protein